MKKKIEKESAAGIENRYNIRDALVKKAKGYKSKDEVREYVIDEDGTERLIKIKRTEYEIHPDMAALRLLFEEEKGNDKQELTDYELSKTKERLLKELLILSEETAKVKNL